METNQTASPPKNDEIIVQSVQKTPPEAEPVEVVDASPGQRRGIYIEMSEDELGQWHWCLWSANGRAICACVASFTRRNDCHKNVETAIELFRSPTLKVVATVGG